MKKRYTIKPSLSVRKVKDSLNIGTLPPVGVVIDDYPDYLLDLTYYLSDSRTKDEIIQFLIRKSDLKLSEAELVFDDLYNNRIISEFQYDRNERYSRHKLYYDLVSTSSELLDYQERLANKKVGLIGMGGMG